MQRKKGPEYHWRDVGEAAVGACIMAFPIAVTEEVWNLGAQLPTGRVLLFSLASIAILALVVFTIHRDEKYLFNRRTFLLRVFCTYSISLLIGALLLLGVDRFDLFQEPAIALKRTIIVAFPASFAATAVDSINGQS